jgi:hypothetical protein
VDFSTRKYYPTSRYLHFKVSLNQWLFDIAVANLHGGMFSAFAYVYGCRFCPGNQNVTRMLLVAAEKTEKHCADAAPQQEESRLKTSNHQFARRNVFGLCIRLWVLSRKIETGLECDQRLLRKLKITVTGAKLLYEHSVSPFSRQLLTPYESCFDFPDRLNTHERMQRQKTFSRANRQRLFPRRLACSPAQRLPHEDSVSPFSGQPPTLFEPRFDFPDRLDPYQLMQTQKTFCTANQRRLFLGWLSSPHAVHEVRVFQFSRQLLTPFESRFDFPDQLDPYQLMQTPKTFRRANQQRIF